MSGDAGGINKLELSSCQTGVQPINKKKQVRTGDKTPQKLSSLTHDTKLRHNTTTQPIYHHHQTKPLPSHSTQRQGTRQQGETTKPLTANSERKRREARNDFFDQNQRHLTEFALYQIKSNTTFFFLSFVFLGLFVIYSVRLFFQSEDIVHLLIFSDLFCKTV